MSFEIPEDHGYLETHEWISLDDGVGEVGITDFAQDELGDVIFIELPEARATFSQEDQFGTIESIKALSDLYLPMSGEIVEVNDRLFDEPELVNQNPYGDGWMLRVETIDEGEFDDLLSAAEYRDQIN